MGFAAAMVFSIADRATRTCARCADAVGKRPRVDVMAETRLHLGHHAVAHGQIADELSMASTASRSWQSEPPATSTLA